VKNSLSLTLKAIVELKFETRYVFARKPMKISTESKSFHFLLGSEHLSVHHAMEKHSLSNGASYGSLHRSIHGSVEEMVYMVPREYQLDHLYQ
jgi:hypothetical protein